MFKLSFSQNKVHKSLELVAWVALSSSHVFWYIILFSATATLFDCGELVGLNPAHTGAVVEYKMNQHDKHRFESSSLSRLGWWLRKQKLCELHFPISSHSNFQSFRNQMGGKTVKNNFAVVRTFI